MASSSSKAARPSAEIDSFLLSMRMGMESSKEDEEEEREDGTGGSAVSLLVLGLGAGYKYDRLKFLVAIKIFVHDLALDCCAAKMNQTDH